METFFLVKKESCVFIVRFEHAFLASGFNMRFEQALTFKTFVSIYDGTNKL